MTLTLRTLFDQLAGAKGYLELNDLRKAADHAHVEGAVLGIDIVARATDKIWSRLDPEEKGKLTWEEFKAQGLALLPESVTDDPAKITMKAWELFGNADAAVCKDDQVTCEELEKAVSPMLKLPFFMRPARGQLAAMTAQLTFAILGKELASGAISKDEYARILDDLKEHAGIP